MYDSRGAVWKNSATRIEGLKRGIVKDLNDPQGLNRVKVTLIDGEIETEYADVMAFFAGKDLGAVFIPRPGEEVLIGFIDGDIGNPIILGGLYNSVNKPSLAIDKNKNEIMMIKFPAGLRIQIDNKKDNQKISITTKKGHTITLDDGSKEEVLIKEKGGKTSFGIDFKNGVIDLKAAQKISMAAGKSTMVLDSQNGLAVKSASGKLNVDVNAAAIKTKTNAAINAGANATVKGTAQAVFQASGPVTVKGALVKIN